MIIGITGTNGAGKDTVAEFFIKQGYERLSLSDELRKELKKRNIPETREAMDSVGRELKKKEGYGTLAKRVKKSITEKNTVIVSIRNPFEVEALQELPNFHLIAVDAPPNVRYERTQGRKRAGDDISFEKFVTQDTYEREGKNPEQQQVNRVMDMADSTVMNNSTKKELFKKLTTIQTQFSHQEQPNLDG